MLRDWIAPLDLETFTATHLGRDACARAGTATTALDVLDWSAAWRILVSDPPPDAIVCAKGERLPWPMPRDRDELKAYFRMGVGLCLRHTQRCTPELARIAEAFERDVGGRAQVQVFVTPAGTHGFGWHYDLEHVFIAQTIGVKDYYFRPNTVEADAAFPPKDFSGFHRETSPLYSATLVPGDFLYIPSRWWHMAVARDDTLSISVGVMPPEAEVPTVPTLAA